MRKRNKEITENNKIEILSDQLKRVGKKTINKPIRLKERNVHKNFFM